MARTAEEIWEESKDFLAVNLRRIRKSERISQAELGKVSGTSKNTIYDIENKRASPELKTLCRIASALDVALPALFANPRLQTGKDWYEYAFHDERHPAEQQKAQSHLRR